MGKCSTLLVLLVVIISYICWQRMIFYKTTPPEIHAEWWGEGKTRKCDTTVKPFAMNITKEVLSDLQNRLERTCSFTSPIDGAGFTYGFNTDYLSKILEFWKKNYKWHERQDYFNSLPQFTTEVAGLRIHYIHLKPKVSSEKVLPLLVLHGWAESLRNLYEYLPLLTKPRQGQDFVFEVIAPSLPGFGFSQGTSKPGFGSLHHAVMFDTMMQQLGYTNYYVQGGDFGSQIATFMAQLYPKRIQGLHITLCLVSFSPWTLSQLIIGSIFPSFIVEKHEEKSIYPLSDYFNFIIQNSGYFHEQSTKPDTIGVALNESPIGAAAYILELYSTITDPAFRKLPDGGLQNKYELTDLLDIIMMYWFSGSITSSMRLYSESFSSKQRQLRPSDVAVQVPSACARFPHEVYFTPISIIRQKFTNLVHVTDFESGGHFASFENPKLLAEDVWAAVAKMQPKQSI